MTMPAAAPSGPSIHAVDRLDLVAEPWRWRFAEERRADIAAHFAAVRARSPAVWNGRVLLMHEYRLAGRALAGRWFETGFADFVAWRDWGRPDASVTNCFSMGALRTSDGAFLLGVMGAHTANPGHIYFAAGTPDPRDVIDGRVDLAGSVLREVAEETGLDPADYAAEPGWQAVVGRGYVALIRTLAAPMPAADLRARILDHLAAEAEPELADIRIVRGAADLDPMMPEFVTTFLAHAWRR
jgi:8-oxo-dGTP pyrophosphatase MutT (NUDIX family)